LGLGAYIARRLLLFIPVLIGVTILIFLISMSFTPEQRAVLYARSPKQLRSLRQLAQKYHLYDPIHIQYINWLNNVLHGNLGWSITANMPVSQAIIEFFPATLELVLYSAPFIYIVGTRLGIISAVKRDTAIDHGTRVLAIIGWALPTFWSAILLLSVFYGHLDLFPPGRLGEAATRYVQSPKFTRYTGLNTIDALLNGEIWIFLDALRHLVLPVTNLVIVTSALIMRVMRSSMLETLSKAYITMARAKGLDEKEVINKHARRNALIPVITVTGSLFATMICGLVVTESVFNYMGIGYWAAKAAVCLDIAAILGFSLFVAIVFVVTNLIVDVLYAFLDPRIRLG